MGAGVTAGGGTETGHAPPWQEPPRQASSHVEALPSSQLAVLLVKTQPVAELQLSAVQTFPSSQFFAEPRQVPEVSQTSPVVQASPSVQLLLSRMLTPQLEVPLQ